MAGNEKFRMSKQLELGKELREGILRLQLMGFSSSLKKDVAEELDREISDYLHLSIAMAFITCALIISIRRVLWQMKEK